MVNPGTEVIDLLSDDSLSDIEEYVVQASSRQRVGSSSHQRIESSSKQRVGSSSQQHTENTSTSKRAIIDTPATSRTIINTPVSSERVAPDTPELPSPSLLLGAPRRSTSSPTKQPRSTTTTLLSRQTVLALPSSPPLCDTSDPLFHLIDTRSNGNDDNDDNGDDDAHFLDKIIQAQTDEWSDPGGLLGSRGLLGGTRVFGTTGPVNAGPEFSDAVATEILGSDSSDSDGANDGGDARIKDLLARASALTKSLRKTDIPRRAYSASEAVSITTLDTSLPPSIEHNGLDHSSSSSSVHIPWSEDGSDIIAFSQAETRKEREKQQKQLLKEQKRKEKAFARGVSTANRKRVEVSELMHDMTMVVDPGVLKHMRNGDDDEGDSTHAVFAKCREQGVRVRVEEGAATGGVWWTMRVRRTWDTRLNLFVPVEPPTTRRVRQMSMVVLAAKQINELCASGRLLGLLEIWRASLKTKRLFVCVLGMQKLVRRAADEETREFARQMRLALRDDADVQRRPRRAPANNSNNNNVDVEAVVMQLQVTCPWITWFTQCSDTASSLGQLLCQTTGDLALSEF
ncbi:hypothetical protein GGF43_005271, partial [Coemansia sp. RSA 2618]